MNRLGILLSGRGSNFQAIARNVEQGRLKADIAAVISNVDNAPGLAIARELGLATYYVSPRQQTRESFDRQVVTILQERSVDLVCLAGFMRLLSPFFVRCFHQRILNIHPSLLPAFPGLDAPRQALQHGVKFSGCTVHFVDEGLDSGPIILQSIVPVLDQDDEASLAARILVEEHRIYSEAIDLVLAGKIRVEGRRVLQL